MVCMVRTTQLPKVAVECLETFLPIREIWSSNLGLKTSNLLSGFPQSLKVNAGIVF